MAQPIYSVSQVNGYIKGLLDTDPALTGYNLRGGIPTLPTAVNEVLCLD